MGVTLVQSPTHSAGKTSRRRKRTLGFSLIELMVGLSVLGIVVMLLPNLVSMINRTIAMVNFQAERAERRNLIYDLVLSSNQCKCNFGGINFKLNAAYNPPGGVIINEAVLKDLSLYADTNPCAGKLNTLLAINQNIGGITAQKMRVERLVRLAPSVPLPPPIPNPLPNFTFSARLIYEIQKPAIFSDTTTLVEEDLLFSMTAKDNGGNNFTVESCGGDSSTSGGPTPLLGGAWGLLNDALLQTYTVPGAVPNEGTSTSLVELDFGTGSDFDLALYTIGSPLGDPNPLVPVGTQYNYFRYNAGGGAVIRRKTTLALIPTNKDGQFRALYNCLGGCNSSARFRRLQRLKAAPSYRWSTIIEPGSVNESDPAGVPNVTKIFVLLRDAAGNNLTSDINHPNVNVTIAIDGGPDLATVYSGGATGTYEYSFVAPFISAGPGPDQTYNITAKIDGMPIGQGWPGATVPVTKTLTVTNLAVP